jgi:hypothetical protein
MIVHDLITYSCNRIDLVPVTMGPVATDLHRTQSDYIEVCETVTKKSDRRVFWYDTEIPVVATALLSLILLLHVQSMFYKIEFIESLW